MTSVNKYKYLLGNIGLLTLSQFGSKFLSFFLVPLYTSVLTTEEYGTFDMYYTTVSLMIPILCLNISESVLRFSLDKVKNKDEIFSFGLYISIVGIILFAALVFINCKFKIIDLLCQYPWLLIFMFITTSISQLLSCYARGVDNMRSVAIGGILSTVVILSLNVYFLLFLQLGLLGYFYATIIGALVTCVYFLYTLEIHTAITINISKKCRKEMLLYSIPMILTTVSWWINSASGRYFVIGYCGIAANGIYSVSYKLPTLLNLFQSIFNSAWILSAVKEYNEGENKERFFSMTYNYYMMLMVLVCSLVIVTTQISSSILFAKDFYAAWQYVPCLTISIVFGSMSGYVGGIFAAEKDTKAFGYTVFYGAIANVVATSLLVPVIGVMGAAVATLLSYWLIWQTRMLWIRKYITLDIRMFRDYAAFFILCLQAMGLFIKSQVLMYSIEFILLFLLLLFYGSEIRALYKRYHLKKSN